MKHLGKISLVFILFIFTSCVSTNQFLSMGGANGTKENSTVGIDVLIEMVSIVRKSTMTVRRYEIMNSHIMWFKIVVSLLLSYVVLITVEMFSRILTFRPFQDKKLSAGIIEDSEMRRENQRRFDRESCY